MIPNHTFQDNLRSATSLDWLQMEISIRHAYQSNRLRHLRWFCLATKLDCLLQWIKKLAIEEQLQQRR